MTDENINIDHLFRQMNSWRNFPKFKLEERSSMFWAMCIPDIMSNELKTPASMIALVPEFPIKKRYTKKGKADSTNVDFLAIAVDGNGLACKSAFIELKTDSKSIRADQYSVVLDDIKDESFNVQHYLEDIKEILAVTRQYKKYLHMLRNLESYGLVKVSEDIISKAWNNSPDQLGEDIVRRNIDVIDRTTNLEMYYLVPNKNEMIRKMKERKEEFEENVNVIEFSECADRIRDPKFSVLIKEWIKPPAKEKPHSI